MRGKIPDSIFDGRQKSLILRIFYKMDKLWWRRQTFGSWINSWQQEPPGEAGSGTAVPEDNSPCFIPCEIVLKNPTLGELTLTCSYLICISTSFLANQIINQHVFANYVLFLLLSTSPLCELSFPSYMTKGGFLVTKFLVFLLVLVSRHRPL